MSTYRYTTRDDALQAINDGVRVKPDDCHPRVLRARVWISGAGSPGCLYDSGPNYHASRADAIEDCLFIADSGEGAPRGMRASLRRYGSAYANGWRYEIGPDTLGGIL